MSADMVIWPEQHSSTDEGGTTVIAYWPSGDTTGFTVTLTGVITEAHPRADVDQVFPAYMDLYETGAPATTSTTRSAPLLAGVQLASTTQVLWDDDADLYWRATRDDLTEAGRALLDQLDATYGRPAILITQLTS